jgi:hypothetical protein
MTLSVAVNATEAMVRGISRHLPLASVSTTRFDVRQVRPTKKATVSVSRAMIRRVGKVLLKVMTLVVFMAKIKARFVTFTATVTLARASVRRIGLTRADTVSLVRFRALRAQLLRARAVSLVGARQRALAIRRLDVMTVGRAMVRRIAATKLDTVTLNGASVRARVRLMTLAAVVALTRFSTRASTRVRVFVATVTLAGAKVRQVGLRRLGQVLTTPTVIRRTGKLRTVVVTATEFRRNAAAKALRVPVVLNAASSLIKLKRLTLAAVVVLNARTAKRISHAARGVSTLVARTVRQPALTRRATVAVARFRSLRTGVVRLAVSTTAVARLRALAPVGKVAQVHFAGAHRVFLGVRRAAVVTTARTMTRALARTRLAQVSTVRGLRRALARTTHATAGLTARTVTATAYHQAYRAVLSIGRTMRRGLGVRRAGQVLTSPIMVRSVLRRRAATVATLGTRSVKRGYALARLALVTTVGARIAHRTVVKAALASIALTAKRVRRISRTTLRVVAVVGGKRVAIRLTNATRTATSVILRGMDRVLRLLAPGHSSPGTLTGRKADASAATGRASMGGMVGGNASHGAAMIGRSTTGGIAGNRGLGSGMTGVTNVVNGAVSMYRVVKTARVSPKGKVTHV